MREAFIWETKSTFSLESCALQQLHRNELIEALDHHEPAICRRRQSPEMIATKLIAHLPQDSGPATEVRVS